MIKVQNVKVESISRHCGPQNEQTDTSNTHNQSGESYGVNNIQSYFLPINASRGSNFCNLFECDIRVTTIKSLRYELYGNCPVTIQILAAGHTLFDLSVVKLP